jgi:hypothetical protein
MKALTQSVRPRLFKAIVDTGLYCSGSKAAEVFQSMLRHFQNRIKAKIQRM